MGLEPTAQSRSQPPNRLSPQQLRVRFRSSQVVRRGGSMVRNRYVCGILAASVLAAATIVVRAQAPVPGGPALAPLPMPEILKQYQSISPERLKTPADGEWPMIRRTYDGWGYSPLSQITTDNVKRLQ